MKKQLAINHKFFLTISLLALSSCTGERTIWNKPLGESVFGDLFSSNKEKEEKAEPLVTYNALQKNIGSDLTDGYSNPLNKVKVGEKIVDGFTPTLPKLEPVITGDAKQLHDNITNAFPPDISGIVPSGGDDFPPPLPDLPFSDLNKNPLITSPFSSLDSIPKAPPTEFFFDELQKPPVLG